MDYLYYPGCSIKESGIAYEESLTAIMDVLNTPLQELEDWNCCGATTCISVESDEAIALASRNLALAEKQSNSKGTVDLVTPCNACYLTLMRATHYLSERQDIAGKVLPALDKQGLHCDNRVRIRHPLDVLVNDVGVKAISDHVRRKLTGLKVACYYGCQMVRPYATFDDPHHPTSMDQVMKALGAQTIDWSLKTKCCGAALGSLLPDIGEQLCHDILREAEKRGAEVVVTGCPLCHFNLESNQSAIRKRHPDFKTIPVAYFSQIMGLGFDLPPKTLGIQRLFIPLPASLTAGAGKGGEYVTA